MKLATLAFLTVFLLALCVAPAHAGTRVLNKEGMIGATGGAVAGGVVGHQSGHRTGGAIIGGVAGYAIGTTLHRQKQREKSIARQRQLEMEHARLREEAYRREAYPTPEVSSVEPAAPRLTNSEQQQLLLQSYPVFTVRSRN
jgi:hypothetical protein